MSRSSAGQRIGDAWPQRLFNTGEIGLLWMRARGAASSREVVAELREVLSYAGPSSFDVCVLQVGIVDCTPRPMPRWMHVGGERIGLGRWIRAAYPVLSRFRSRPWVSADRFARYMSIAIGLALTCADRVLVVPIAMPGAGLAAKVGAFDDEVRQYNALLRSATLSSADRAVVVDVPEWSSELLLPDGHHLSTEGHALIAAAIARELTLAPPG